MNQREGEGDHTLHIIKSMFQIFYVLLNQTLAYAEDDDMMATPTIFGKNTIM